MSDLDAERATLAACLWSPVARDEARKHITGADFADPRHERIWDAMAALDRAKTPVDHTAVRASLDGDLPAMDLMPALYTHPAVPDNVATYAATVREHATSRRAHNALIKASQDLDAPGASSLSVVTSTIQRLTEIRDSGNVDDVTSTTLGELLAEPDDEPDWLIPGLLEKRDRLMLTGEEGLGKALAVDTPIPTPLGWTTMGELRAGDAVFAPNGEPTRVVAATDVMHDRPCYRLTFSDGAQIVADANHLWLTETLNARGKAQVYAKRAEATKPRGTDQRHKRASGPRIVTTEQIAQTLTARDGHAVNHSIETCRPVYYPRAELLIDPYVLGAWLGDGSSTAGSITTHDGDHEILDRIAASGWPVRKAKAKYLWMLGDGTGKGKRGTATFAGCLRALGVYGNKHIPDAYRYSSVEQRLALLQGLMDTDGTVSKGASPVCEFSVTSERLATGVLEVLLSLGIKAKIAEGPAKLHGREVGRRYRITFQTDLPVFHLSRKADRLHPLRTRRAKLRYIVACERVESVPVRCIQVARSDGMFLAGREFIPTHNSYLLRQIAIMANAGLHPFEIAHIRPLRVHIIDAENSERQIKRKSRPVATFANRYGTRSADSVNILTTGRMDIVRDRDLARIHRELEASQPELVVIGPIYKLVPRAIQTDDEAAPLLAALDSIREKFDCALLIEAHAGNALGEGGKRNLRPRGSSALLGWPEFGYGMRQVASGYADLVPWRGDRDERDWPQRVRHDNNRVRWIPVDATAISEEAYA